MPDLQTEVERSLAGLDGILLAIKASGGYKYRAFLKGSEKEIDDHLKEAIPKLRGMIVSLVLAEYMLQEDTNREWQGGRWEEYLERRQSTLDAIRVRAEAAAAGRKTQMLQVIKNPKLEEAKA